MIHRGSRRVRASAVLVVMGVVAAFAAAEMHRRWRFTGLEDVIWSSDRSPVRGDERMAWTAEDGLRGRGRRSLPPLPALAGDPRLAPLRRAAGSWQEALGSRRRVVDQVCLVPDFWSFLEAIAAWDDRHYFPILIDEPEWTLPFLQAFRPARVVRYAARKDPPGAGTSPAVDVWQAALRAVAKGWTPPTAQGEELPPAGAPPRLLGETPPGQVLAAPDSPMLAGAVALAAGRFQPLVRLDPEMWGLGDSSEGGAVRYGDVLSLPQAWEFARHLEARVASVVPRYDQLGDDCDFLTIAGDWPYRYDNPSEGGPARGIHALDDLIGRSLVGEPDAQGLNASRRRWAFTGRLLGGPAASVARAMAAMFLTPDLTMLWDTYAPGSAHSHYTTGPAAHLLGRAGVVGPGTLYFAAGPAASLASWDRIMDPWNRFGLIWLNSSGSPTDFSIVGGPGRPADVPGGIPAAVVMIHSFSAADPADSATIAGRWLTQGAFVYFGSVNEPYLQAFRKPGLVADLAIRGVPLSAALRQGEFEPLGRPWRLVYLGDPLYRIPLPAPSGGTGSPDNEGTDAPTGRLAPESWRRDSPESAGWPAVAVKARPEGPPSDRDDDRLRWCRDAAVAELAWGSRVAPTLVGGAVLGVWNRGPAWRPVLKRIARDRLDPRLRPDFDELIVEVLSHSGEWDELQARLSRVPPSERRARAWAALESGAMFRLARAARDPDRERGRQRVGQLMDEVAHSVWPPGSGFPGQFAERAAAVLREPSR